MHRRIRECVGTKDVYRSRRPSQLENKLVREATMDSVCTKLSAMIPRPPLLIGMLIRGRIAREDNRRVADRTERITSSKSSSRDAGMSMVRTRCISREGTHNRSI